MKKLFFKRLGNLLFLSLLLSSGVSCTMLRSNNDLNLHKKYFVDHLNPRPRDHAHGQGILTGRVRADRPPVGRTAGRARVRGHRPP